MAIFRNLFPERKIFYCTAAQLQQVAIPYFDQRFAKFNIDDSYEWQMWLNAPAVNFRNIFH